MIYIQAIVLLHPFENYHLRTTLSENDLVVVAEIATQSSAVTIAVETHIFRPTNDKVANQCSSTLISIR